MLEPDEERTGVIEIVSNDDLTIHRSPESQSEFDSSGIYYYVMRHELSVREEQACLV